MSDVQSAELAVARLFGIVAKVTLICGTIGIVTVILISFHS